MTTKSNISNINDVVLLSGHRKFQSFENVRCKIVGGVRCGRKGYYGNFLIDDAHEPILIRFTSPDCIVYSNQNIETSLDNLETEAEIADRIEERFKILKTVAKGIGEGEVRSLIVSGAPGVGKTEGIVSTLDEVEKTHGISHSVIRGTIVSAFQLYMVLYEHSDQDCVLVLDDCDQILFDSTCINMLKAALESGTKPRTISYRSQSVENAGLPTAFDFNGRVVFITNVDFQSIIDKDRKDIAKHLAALIDRSLYLDLTLRTTEEIYARIAYVVRQNQLLKSFKLNQSQQEEILTWIKSHMNDVRSLSLRTAIHLGEMFATNQQTWKRMADAFLLKKAK